MDKENGKTQHSIWNNICFLIRKAWKIDKTLLVMTLLQVPVIVLLPLSVNYLSKMVVQLVEYKVNVSAMIGTIVFISAGNLVLRLLKNYSDAKIEWRAFQNRFSFIGLCCQKIMHMDYENIESPAGQTKMQKAFNSLYNNESGTQQIFAQIVNVGSNLIGLLTYSILLLELSPWIVLLLFGLTLLNYYIGHKKTVWLHKNKDNWVPIDRKIQYLQGKIRDFEVAKDIRLYHMVGWIKEMFQKFHKERIFWHKKGETYGFGVDACSAFLAFVRDAVAYYVLIHKAVHGDMSIADFVFYFGLITQYSSWLVGVFQSYNQIYETCLGISDLRDFLDIEDTFNHQKGVRLPVQAPDIEFKNISYQYAGNEEKTLKSLNFKIKSGEKVAIVGLNGAGKTTLIKLLCGLYEPTEGRIEVGGRSIREYCIEDYYSMLSVVFQDILFLPVSIAKNIALTQETDIDRKKLEQVLKLSGLYEKVQNLPHKEETVLVKSVMEDAVDLSGGEKQKLALARALYQNGKIMVLDEPTAALDPIAESEMYRKYNDLTKETTSIFISHRLSSTRFCDRIFYMENGEIVEEGSHDELIRLDGKYANLYQVQSQYYKEDVQ